MTKEEILEAIMIKEPMPGSAYRYTLSSEKLAEFLATHLSSTGENKQPIK